MTRRGATRAVLLDLDGTLLNTVPDLAAAVNATLAELGLGTLPEEAVREFIGHGIAHLVRRSVERAAGAAASESTFESALVRFGAHYERENGRAACVFPGVREGLEAMVATGMALGCVTNKATRFTMPLLEKVDLARYFATVVCGDTTAKRKPAAEPFLYACAELDARPADTVVIGDSANDAQGARAAGCRVLLVPYGYREGRDVCEIECDGIVATLLEAARVLSAQDTQS